jgi:putative methanogenesis marker protein 3
MRIKLNGKEIDAPQNTSLADLLPEEDNLVVIVRERKAQEKLTDTFKLKIGKESMTLKVENEVLWNSVRDKIQGLEVAWRTKRVLAFGPFSCDLRCSKVQHDYEPGEIFLSLAGGSKESAYLMFAVTRYQLGHCTVGDGVIGRVIEGLRALRFLEIGEKIEKIEPVFDRGVSAGIKTRAEMTERILEGDEIYSQVTVGLKKEVANASDYAMAVLERNPKVEEVTNTYVRFKGIVGIEIGEENPEKRFRGAVTIRRTGKNTGDIYIYLRDRMPHRDHCVVGFVESGIELLEVAKKGDKIRIVTNPGRIDLVGLTQLQAQKLLAEKDIRQLREGETDDNAIVASQIPETTFEILSGGVVTTFGVAPNRIVKVKLFQELAPKTASYFRIATGLVNKKVGKLQVYFKTKDLAVFRPNVTFGEPLIPENTPEEIVKPGEIGVTNMSRKHAGLIGVRFIESRDFGPTAERFESTNLVGVVLENFEVIKNSKEGEVVYFMEVME